MQKLAGTTRGASTKVLRTAALSLVYSTAEYCSPVWLNSAHVRGVDVQLNKVMRTISGTLPWIPVLCYIANPEIRRKEALLREYNKIMSAPNLPILQDLPPERNRLRSQKPPFQSASSLIEEKFSPKTAWAES